MKQILLTALAAAVLASAAACSPDKTTPKAALDSAGPGHPPPASATRSDDPRLIPTSAQAAGSATTTTKLPDFTKLVEAYGDSVVNVDVVGSVQPPGTDKGADPALRDFFRHFGIPPGADQPADDAPMMRGAASGFIVSADGYILTNAHVVAEADDVTVRLTDRREFPAKVIGTDPRTDVAVIKIDAKNLPAVRIGDPSAIRPGEWVLAIGSPFGLESTATAGIVSGTARAVSSDSNVPFIQTDVAVNPGNSGGPLFNLKGEVVGINSMIFSESGGYMGISFAIPIDIAMDVEKQLVKNGRVVRGRIGVAAQNVDASLANSFQLDRPRGALVSSVERGGPADAAGVKPGDIILEVNGKPVERSADLSTVIAATAPGREAQLTVWRGGKQRDLTVKVAQLEDKQQRVAEKRTLPAEDESKKLGLVVRSLTPDEKEQVATKGSVVVADVEGAAARAGLQPGDIILAVNNKPVHTVQDLRSVAGKMRGGDSAALLVERGGTQIYVPLRAAS
jgi:serine protease Do